MLPEDTTLEIRSLAATSQKAPQPRTNSRCFWGNAGADVSACAMADTLGDVLPREVGTP